MTTKAKCSWGPWEAMRIGGAVMGINRRSPEAVAIDAGIMFQPVAHWLPSVAFCNIARPLLAATLAATAGFLWRRNMGSHTETFSIRSVVSKKKLMPLPGL